MDSNGGTPTKRVELENGQWAELRTYATALDMRLIQEDRIRVGRGADVMLDTMALLPARIVQWSLGPVTSPAIDALTSEDALTLMVAVREAEMGEVSRPNPSSPSPAGTRRRGRAKPPQSG